MVQEIDVRELSEMLAAGESIRLLDVRQEWEHDIAALPDSQLIPLDQLTVRAEEVTRTDGQAIVVYCHHGIRSRSAAALLEHFGVAEVASLRGGIDAWSLHIDPSVPRY